MKTTGRARPDIMEVSRLWSVLPEQERREWDNRAREEEKRVVQELKDRPDGEEAGTSQASFESDEEDRNLLALQLPFGAQPYRAPYCVL